MAVHGDAVLVGSKGTRSDTPTGFNMMSTDTGRELLAICCQPPRCHYGTTGRHILATAAWASWTIAAVITTLYSIGFACARELHLEFPFAGNRLLRDLERAWRSGCTSKAYQRPLYISRTSKARQRVQHRTKTGTWTPDRAVRFDLTGNPLEILPRAHRPGNASMAFRGRPIPRDTLRAIMCRGGR